LTTTLVGGVMVNVSAPGDPLSYNGFWLRGVDPAEAQSAVRLEWWVSSSAGWNPLVTPWTWRFVGG
jgi:hypothetical protein